MIWLLTLLACIQMINAYRLSDCPGIH